MAADFLQAARDLVPERERQIINLGNASLIMNIRMTYPRSRDANQNVRRSDLGNWNVRLNEPHRPHFVSATRALNGHSSYSTNECVQLRYIQAGLAIVLPCQLEKSESILVGSNRAIHRLIQIDEASLNDEQRHHGLR